MLTKTRIIALISSMSLLALLAVVSVFSPYRIALTVERTDQVASAAKLYDVPVTATPMPPTATAVPPTATNAPPTATDEPSAPTEVPATPRPTKVPPHKQDQPTPVVGTALPTVTPVPSTPVAGVPNVLIEKTANVAAVQRGEAVVFTLTARNAGSETARDVVITDMVPQAFRITGVKSTKGDVVADGQTVTGYPATLNAGEQVVITITTKARADATAGDYRNTALITTSSTGDTPDNNTSTVTVAIRAPAPAKPVAPAPKAPKATPVPQSMPDTANPDAPTFLMVWGPWMMFAVMLAMFGGMLRFGMFRTRFVTIGPPVAPRVSTAPAAPPQVARDAVSIEIDAEMVVAHWRGGASVRDLTQIVAEHNPHASRVVIGLAVQKLISEQRSA